MRVKCNLGLHARPATHLVQLLQHSKSTVLFRYKGLTINAKSILELLSLAAPKNALITIQVSGEDALKTLELIVESFENGFAESKAANAQ